MSRKPDHELIAEAVRVGLAHAAGRAPTGPATPGGSAPSVDEQVRQAMQAKQAFLAAVEAARVHFEPTQLAEWIAPPPKEGTP